MDRRHNPYAPGAGTPPPHELFGRAEIIEEIEVILLSADLLAGEESPLSNPV